MRSAACRPARCAANAAELKAAGAEEPGAGAPRLAPRTRASKDPSLGASDSSPPRPAAVQNPRQIRPHHTSIKTHCRRACQAARYTLAALEEPKRATTTCTSCQLAHAGSTLRRQCKQDSPPVLPVPYLVRQAPNRTGQEVEVDRGRAGRRLARAEVSDGRVAADAPRRAVVRQRGLLRRVERAQPQARALRRACQAR